MCDSKTFTCPFLTMIWNTACDLEECWLAEVVPDVLQVLMQGEL